VTLKPLIALARSENTVVQSKALHALGYFSSSSSPMSYPSVKLQKEAASALRLFHSIPTQSLLATTTAFPPAASQITLAATNLSHSSHVRVRAVCAVVRAACAVTRVRFD
jgi:hypothetical protein